MSDLDDMLASARAHANDRALQQKMIGEYLEDPVGDFTQKAVKNVEGVFEAAGHVKRAVEKIGGTIGKDVAEVTGDPRFEAAGLGITTGGVTTGNPALAATGLGMVGMAKIGKGLLRPRFNVDEIVERALNPSPLADRVTQAVNEKTAVLTDAVAQERSAALIQQGGVTRETLSNYAPGTSMLSASHALAAQDILTTESRTFIDTARTALDSGDEQLAEQALAQFARLLDPASGYAGAVTTTAQTLRLSSSEDIKALNLLLERSSKTSGTMKPIDQLKAMLADPATDPAKQGKSVTQTYRNITAQAREVVAQGDDNAAKVLLHEIQETVKDEAQISLFPEEKAVKAAQKEFKNVTAQHIVEANARVAEQEKDRFRLERGDLSATSRKPNQTDFVKEQEKAHQATIKEHQAQDMRAAAGESAFDKKRKRFQLTPPRGGAPAPRKPSQLDLLNLIATEIQPEQLAIEMAETIEVGNKELSKQFHSLIRHAQEAIASGDQERVGKALQRIQKVFETKAKPDELQRPQRLVEQEKKAIQQFLMRDGNKDLSPTEMLKAMLADPNLQPDALITAINNAKNPTWRDAWQYLIINSMLGPSSDFINFAATSSMLPVHLVTRTAGARIGKAAQLLGGKAGVIIGEDEAMIHGLFASFWDSIKLAGRVAKTNMAEIGPQAVRETQLGQNPLSSQAVFGYSPTARFLAGIKKPQDAASSETLSRAGMVARAIDTVGIMTGLPGRLMLTGDQFVQSLAMAAEQHAVVYRKASQQAVRDGLTERQFYKAYRPLWKEVSGNLPEEIRKKGEAFSLDVSLNADLGVIGDAVMNVRHAVDKYTGIGGTIALPFFKTLVNSSKATWEFSPFAPTTQALGIVAKQFRDDMFGSDPVKRDIAMGKWAVGSMIMSSLVWSAVNGRLRGRGPDNKELRQQVIAAEGLPDSFVLNADDGTSVQINRMGILGNLAGMAADAAEVWLQADETTWADIAQLLTTAIVGNLSFDFIQASGGILQALANGVKRKEDLDLIARTLPALIPLSATIKAGEKLLATDDQPLLMKDARETLDKILALFPGYDSLAELFGLPKVPLLRNQFGYAVRQPRSAFGTEWFNPLFVSHPSQQDGMAELSAIENDLGVAIQQPMRTIGKLGLPLTNDEYERYQMLAGYRWEQRALQLLPTLRRADVTDQTKRNLIEEHLRLARQTAAQELFAAEPGLVEAVIEQRRHFGKTIHTKKNYQRPSN